LSKSFPSVFDRAGRLMLFVFVLSRYPAKGQKKKAGPFPACFFFFLRKRGLPAFSKSPGFDHFCGNRRCDFMLPGEKENVKLYTNPR